jgi:segregation and condensation protein A
LLVVLVTIGRLLMDFEEDKIEDEERFIVRFDAWEGPIEALLDLAKTQKVDLASINILDLVDQFEAIVDRAMALRLELAADWLVMATWLAYLKSRVLLKRRKDKKDAVLDDDVLAFHLKRLNMVKIAAERHPERLTLGRDWFAPARRNNDITLGNRLAVSFHDFLATYPKSGENALSDAEATSEVPLFDLGSVDGAIVRLTDAMPQEWINLLELVPMAEGIRLPSNIATTLIAALELTRDRQSDIEQASNFGTILVRRRIDHGE